MSKKIGIVTGANTGLGYEVCLGLAKEGYKIIMACRSESKAQDAMDKLKGVEKDAELDYIKLDLVDRDSIKSFAETFTSKYDKLDVLVNNAGVMCPPHTITKNDLELQFDANHIGHFFLTSLLLKSLDQGPSTESRIVNVTSLAAKRDTADIHFDNLNFDGNYEEGPKVMGMVGMIAYQQSKLANALFTMELKDRLEAQNKTNIKPVMSHPGVSNTGLSKNASLMVRLLQPLLPLVSSNIQQAADGAKPTLMGALEPTAVAGDFFGPTGTEERSGPPGKVPLPDKASDKELAAKLWELSEEKLGAKFEI